MDEQTVKAVYLAVVGLADHAGLECLADDRAIAAAASRTVPEVRAAIYDLQDRGEIRALGPDSDLPNRTLVILAHPDSERHVRLVLFGPRGPSDPLRWIAAQVRAWVGEGHTARVVARLVEERLRRDGVSNRTRDRAMILAADALRAARAI